MCLCDELECRHGSVTLSVSGRRWLQWYPAAAASLLTGAYALIAGLSLLMAPKTMLGESRMVAVGPTVQQDATEQHLM